MLIITGGLGPTHDDITKSVLCEFFNDVLEENLEVVKHLQKIFAIRGRELTDRNREQALVPTTAKVFINDNGTAPGLHFVLNDKHVIALPGVPYEMKALVNKNVLPLIHEILVKQIHNVMMYKTIITSGIPESTLADLLGSPEEFLIGQQLAFLPSYQGVRLRISVHAESKTEGESKIARISDHVYSRAGKYIIGEGDASVSKSLHFELLKRNKTLAIAESCTGGMLGMKMTENPGSSNYFLGGIVCYSNESKVRDVGILQSTLENFGAVSKESAEELAKAVRVKFGSDYGMSVTGIAGPDGGSDEKPVGTVWIACADQHGVKSLVSNYGNDREANRERACAAVILMLLKMIWEEHQ